MLKVRPCPHHFGCGTRRADFGAGQSAKSQRQDPTANAPTPLIALIREGTKDMERDPMNVELDDLKDFRAWVRRKGEEIDRVLRNDDVSNEVKYYFFGMFMAELARRSDVP